MTTTRRSDLGLGRTAAGGNEGSFAGHQRAAAVAPPTPTLSNDALEHARIMAAERRAEIYTVKAAMHRREIELFEAELAAIVLQHHPDATTVVLGRNYDSASTLWRFAGVEAAGEEQIRLDTELQYTLEDTVLTAGIDSADDDYECDFLDGTAHEDGYDQHWSEIARVELGGAIDKVMNGQHFVDTGSLSGADFNHVWAAAQTQLNLSGSAMTNAEFKFAIEEEFTLDSGEDLSDEQATELAVAAAKLYAEIEESDFQIEARMENRDHALKEAAKQLGIKIASVY